MTEIMKATGWPADTAKADVPERPMEIPSGIENLGNELSELAASVAHLEARIRPVLAEQAEPSMEARLRSPTTTLLGGQLDTCVTKVQEIRDQVSVILQRLEI